jgi:predicted DNA-binding transcriptional regulator AlpA
LREKEVKMEKYSRTELIAQVAGLASQANKLLAMLMADMDGGQISESIPVPSVTVKAPSMGGGMGKARDSMTLKEVAAYAHYSEGSIHRLIRDKDFPMHQSVPKSQLYFYPNEVDAWMRQGKRKGHRALVNEANAILNGKKSKR